MKKRKKLLIVLSALVCTSCANEIDKNFTSNESIFIDELSINYLKNQNVLVFESIDDFENVVSILELRSKPNLATHMLYNGLPVSSTDITLKDNGFTSLYDEYVSAMNEAEKYYDTKEDYLIFKEKYPTLYFPEHKDDYSAYLPVKNKFVAKLLNSKGEAMINGNIVNLIDVFSYEQLVDMGLTPPEDGSNAITTRALPLNQLHPAVYNSEHTRKMWVTTDVRPSTSLGVLEDIVVEVHFRAKGLFGAWYNYRNTETRLGWTETSYRIISNKYSSHDYYWARIYQNMQPVPFTGTLCVQYRGIDFTPFYFDVNL